MKRKILQPIFLELMKLLMLSEDYEELNESLVVQKVLRSLLLKYDAKVSAIEETRDLTKMRMDELHGYFIALVAKECKEEDEWFIDSGCSSHMTRDQRKFVILKKKGGNVAFGDDSSTKILGKGTVKLGSENVKAGKVLLVEYLKHNLLSVSKICDQGYTLMFDSQKCKIRENNSGRLVATATRRPNNIYILDMKKREKT
jgi:hypothetical protein